MSILAMLNKLYAWNKFHFVRELYRRKISLGTIGRTSIHSLTAMYSCALRGGTADCQMEAREIATDKGELNRWIKAINALLKEEMGSKQARMKELDGLLEQAECCRELKPIHTQRRNRER